MFSGNFLRVFVQANQVSGHVYNHGDETSAAAVALSFLPEQPTIREKVARNTSFTERHCYTQTFYNIVRQRETVHQPSKRLRLGN